MQVLLSALQVQVPFLPSAGVFAQSQKLFSTKLKVGGMLLTPDSQTTKIECRPSSSFDPVVVLTTASLKPIHAGVFKPLAAMVCVIKSFSVWLSRLASSPP